MYKPHPFVTAIETVLPIFLPSFSLRSSRDQAGKRSYPSVEYVLIRGGNKVYDRSKKTWRSTFEVQLGILLKESKENFWCSCDELKDAKDVQSLFWELEKKLNGIIKTIIDPQSASKNIKFCDLSFAHYDFKLESYLGTQYVRKYDNNLTGVYSVFNLSSYSDDKEYCCNFEDNLQGLKNQQSLVSEDSQSWKKIQLLIDNLSQ